MIAAVSPLIIIIKSLSLDAMTTNLLSFALLALLSTIVGMALLKTLQILDNNSIIKWINFVSFLLFFLSFLMIILSSALSFHLVLLPWITCLMSLITQCTSSSTAQILNVANILPIILHGCISAGIGIAFIWSNHIYPNHNKYVYIGLNSMGYLILFPVFVIIVTYLGLTLWSGLILF